jgi:hypothetical protein
MPFIVTYIDGSASWWDAVNRSSALSGLCHFHKNKPDLFMQKYFKRTLDEKYVSDSDVPSAPSRHPQESTDRLWKPNGKPIIVF